MTQDPHPESGLAQARQFPSEPAASGDTAVRHLFLFAVTLVLFHLAIGSPNAGRNKEGAQPLEAGANPGNQRIEGRIPALSIGPANTKSIRPKNIPPLYSEPTLPGEGVWTWQDMPGGQSGAPLIYRTVYRPSADFPNAVVYMLLFDMKHVSMRLYLGSAEPCGAGTPSKIEKENRCRLLAITNALWQTRHAGPGGVIFRGKILKKMVPRVATIVLYKDESVDILEWNDEIPVSEIRDARQLKHLIVRNGKVVTSIVKRGKKVDAEIGLGSLLNEDRPVLKVPPESPGGKASYKLNLTSGELWFLATRSAFGIRPDGNLVFAVGHHIKTTDLAKALVLAGCVRAIHGDANPGNCVGILYSTDQTGKTARKVKLSPLQDRSTLERYVNKDYPKDFFAYFTRPGASNVHSDRAAMEAGPQ